MDAYFKLVFEKRGNSNLIENCDKIFLQSMLRKFVKNDDDDDVLIR